jgi:SRSO17 transposase
MDNSLEARFDRYSELVVDALAHADRHQPARWYLKGLMLSGGRKSVEPMAARVHPEDVRSAHQSMHHLVAHSEWSDQALLSAVADAVLPALTGGNEPCVWIIDDTGLPKKGQHSVGVARQYCGQRGKTDNCQVAVSVSLATKAGSLPLSYRLYLPQAWTDEPARAQRVGVPDSIAFATKSEMAREQIDAALNAGVPRGPVLADAAYGDETALRQWLSGRGLVYALGVRPATTVWWGPHQPVLNPPIGKRGKTRTHLVRDAHHQPISVEALAQSLPARSFRTVTWREGSATMLRSRFARVRVSAAHRNGAHAEEWLIIEWPSGEALPTRYWMSTLAPTISFKALVNTIKARWRIERDYQDLKQEFGLGHYEGRNWRGFHHHASLCIAAYGFLMLERLTGKKNAARFNEPALPEGFRPRGASADAAASAEFDYHAALSPRACDCPIMATVPLPRRRVYQHNANLITQ